jgi:hypothetical protein
LAPTPEQAELIAACADTERLRMWLRRAVVAASVADVLAEPAP